MAMPAATTADMKAPMEQPTAAPSSGVTEIYHRKMSERHKGGQRSLDRWKGPEKISKIYGDWIEDSE